APLAMHAPDALAPAHNPESCFLVKTNAGGILGENPSLQSPDAVTLRLLDQLGQQRGANSLPPLVLCEVNADLGHAAVDFAAGHGTQRRPPHDIVTVDGHHPAGLQMS